MPNKFNFMMACFLICQSLLHAMEKQSDDVETVDPKEIAALHYEYALANTKQGRAKAGGKASNAGLTYDVLGQVLNTQEVNDGFFSVGWIEKLKVENKLPQELAPIYRFLKAHGFIRPLTTTFALEVLRARQIPPNYKPILDQALNFCGTKLKSVALEFYSQEQYRQSCIQFYPSPHHKPNLLDHHEFGMLLRMASEPSLPRHKAAVHPWFFASDATARALIEASMQSMAKIDEKLEAIQRVLTSSDDAQEVIESLLNCEQIPDAYRKVIFRMRHKSERAVKKIAADIEIARTILETRQASQAKIHHSKLDVLLLYAFYLFEESQGILFDSSVALGILHTFADEPGLSIKDILAPLAHEVLDRLGYSPDFDRGQPSTSENPAAKTMKKGTKQGPKKGKKKAAKSRRTQKRANLPRAEKSTKPSSKKNKTAPLVTVQEQPIDAGDFAEIYQEPLADIDDDGEKERETNTTCKEESWASMCARTRPSKDHCPHVFSHQGGRGAKLNLERGLRRLDTLARLISKELVYNGNAAPGTVALALINQKGADRLVISTKRFTPAWQIVDAIVDAVKNSVSYYEALKNAHDELAVQKKRARQAKNKLDNSDRREDDVIREYYQARLAIDRIKLAKTLSPLNQARGHIEARLEAILNLSTNSIGDALIVLPNSLSVHPEINVAEYVIENHLVLGRISTMRHIKPYAYQYIGLSMLNCGTCDIMLRGGNSLRGFNGDYTKTKLLIFTRGSYGLSYQGYVIPFRAASINKMSLENIRSHMSRHLPDINTVSLANATAKQNADLSDSDDDIDCEL